MHSELAGAQGHCHEAAMRGATVPCPLPQPSCLLLLRRELGWPGRSGVQQHEATEHHSEADPPQRRPRLPEEKLAQDGLKGKDKVLLGQVAPKPPALSELQGLLLGEPALEKTPARTTKRNGCCRRCQRQPALQSSLEAQPYCRPKPGFWQVQMCFAAFPAPLRSQMSSRLGDSS